MKGRAGLYRNMVTGVPLTIVFDKAQLRLGSAGSAANVLVPVSDSAFESPNRARYQFDADGRLSVVGANVKYETYERVAPAHPAPIELKPFVGSYASDEAEVTLDVALEGSGLQIARRPDTKFALVPIYKDAFAAQGLGLIRFRRDADGRVVAFSVVLGRVWDMHFERRGAGATN
jgi:hypothetical protein